MVKPKIVRLMIFPVMLFSMASSKAQEWPVGGVYQIMSGGFGQWVEVFSNTFDFRLPDTNQSYVELAVDAQRDKVQMAILGEDRHTVFSSFGFALLFTNGVVFSDHIQFAWENPLPEEPYWSYTVSNSASGLRIDGVFEGPTGPVHVPTAFGHSNIVAVLVPAVPEPMLSRPRCSGGGAIEFTVFNGQPGQTNIIEASADLVGWTAIGTNVFPATVCPNCPFIDFQDPASTNLDRRYYRAFSLP